MKMFTHAAPYRRKLLIALCALSMLLVNMALADGSRKKNTAEIEIVEPLHRSAPDDPVGTFENVRLEHRGKVDEQKGMHIHVKLIVKNRLNVPCLMVAYFYTKDGAALPSLPYTYRTLDGKVSAFISFTPRYESSEYDDLQISLPYSAFNIKQSGAHDLKVNLVLYSEGKVIGRSADYEFTFKKA